MFSLLLLFAVMLLVAKRLVEVFILIQQRLGRKINAGLEVKANAGCLPKAGEPNVTG
jgi:hypothetical protein